MVEVKEKKIKKIEAQEVEVAVQISGDYCAFHETVISVIYDFTNDVKVGYGDETKEDIESLLEEGHDGDYKDTEMFNALLIDGEYYLNF